ncbi:MAG: adenylate/guanylate cyclase domain-containing protein, partial [Chloroflexota bacterium]
MNCPTCHTANPEFARYCLQCGEALETDAPLTCPQCRVGLPAHARICFVCGLSLGDGTAHDAIASSSTLERVLPKPHIEQPSALQSGVAHERRVVTILFADVKGFTTMSERLDPEDVVEIMHGAFEALIEPIHRYEGTLARLMGDAILAFFGAPIAHEDDPERACRAALDILAGIRRYAERLERERGIPGFTVRVGINTGLVVVGEIGSDSHMEYTATGDAINLAARMETAAEPGTILITADTLKHISHVCETQALGPLLVKGRTEPVRVFRVLKLKDTVDRARVVDDSDGKRAPLLGRTLELSQLRAALSALQDGKGASVAVVGEAGLGKRRLIAEARQAYGERIMWVEAHCLSYTAGMSYWTAREMLRALLGATADAPAAEVGAALRTSLAQIGADEAAHITPADVYPYLARWLDVALDAADEARLQRLSADAVQRQMLRVFAAYIKARARLQPLALVWENLQWVDASSLSVLESLVAVSAEAPLLMVLVFRPNEGHIGNLHQKLMRTLGDAYHVLELTPLARDDGARLLDQLLTAHAPDAALPAELRARMLERAEGNPFFLEEMLRAWLDSGDTRANKSDVPDTLQGVIMARIDRLPPAHKRVLQTASVIGRVFQRRVLARVVDGMMDAPLADALSELRRREFIAPSANAPDDEFSFTHNLTLDVAYNSLLIAQRKALHKLIGETVEAQFPERLDELAATLAHHFEKAESHDKALAYLIHAGQRAARIYANSEAIATYRRALAIADHAKADCAMRLPAHEGLGDVYGLVGEYAPSVEQYEQALACADEPRQRAALRRKLGRVYERWGKGEQAIACFEAGLREMRDAMDAA